MSKSLPYAGDCGLAYEIPLEQTKNSMIFAGVHVFGLSSVSDISKFTKISGTSREVSSDICGVFKTSRAVSIPNTSLKPCHFLFELQGIHCNGNCKVNKQVFQIWL